MRRANCSSPTLLTVVCFPLSTKWMWHFPLDADCICVFFISITSFAVLSWLKWRLFLRWLVLICLLFAVKEVTKQFLGLIQNDSNLEPLHFRPDLCVRSKRKTVSESACLSLNQFIQSCCNFFSPRWVYLTHHQTFSPFLSHCGFSPTFPLRSLWLCACFQSGWARRI